MTDITQKYPLIQTAFDEITLVNAAHGVALSPVVKELQLRACDVIEETVDRPAREKEALMVGMVFRMGLTGIFMGENMRSHFVSKYSAETGTVASDIAAMIHENVPSMTANQAQIEAAFAISVLEKGAVDAEKMSTEEREASAASTRAIRDEAAVSSAKIRSALNAPKMEALYIETEKKYLTALGITPPSAPPSKPATPKM
jgi:hypothetical protein